MCTNTKCVLWKICDWINVQVNWNIYSRKALTMKCTYATNDFKISIEHDK